MTWRTFVSTLLLVGTLPVLPLAFQDGQDPRGRVSPDGSDSGHVKDYADEVIVDNPSAQSQADGLIQLSEVNDNGLFSGGGGSHASNSSTTVPAKGLLPRYRSLIDPETQPPFWWRFVTVPLMTSAQFIVLGFDVRFKPEDRDSWKKTAMSIVKPIVQLSMACVAANCMRNDVLEFLQSLTPEDSWVQTIFKFFVMWVTSPNLEKAVSYFVAVSLQAPSRVFVPDKFRDTLSGFFITVDPEELPMKAKYTKMPVMRYLFLPATPFSARWMTPTKWLYMVVLLPYAFPVWSDFSVSWWWPMAVSCSMCCMTFWPTRLLATCATCCCMYTHLYVFFSSCLGVVITLGLWAKEKNRVAREWTYAWPSLYILELVVANAGSVFFGLLLFGDPWGTMMGLFVFLASPVFLMLHAIRCLCGMTPNQEATAENEAPAEAEIEIEEAKADEAYAGLQMLEQAASATEVEAEQEDIQVKKEEENQSRHEAEIEEAKTEEAQANLQILEQAASATEVEAEQEDIQAEKKEEKQSGHSRAQFAILPFQSTTDMDADFENWNFAEPNDQEMGQPMKQGYTQGTEEAAEKSNDLVDQEPAEFDNTSDIRSLKTWICMMTITASCMLVWFQLFLIIFIRMFTNENTAEGLAKAWGDTLSERTMTGYITYIRRSMTDSAVLASTKVNLVWNFL